MFKHIFQGYILPKDKRSMISMTGYYVENPLGEGREISWRYPYNGVWIIEQETFSIGLQMFFVENWSTIGMLRDSIDMVIRWRSNFGNTKDPSETTYRKVLQFPHGRMDSLAEKDSITIGPRASCARHDITLPGHIKTNVINLGNMFQPSYLAEIQIWLVSGYLRLGMPEKKICNTN